MKELLLADDPRLVPKSDLLESTWVCQATADIVGRLHKTLDPTQTGPRPHILAEARAVATGAQATAGYQRDLITGLLAIIDEQATALQRADERIAGLAELAADLPATEMGRRVVSIRAREIREIRTPLELPRPQLTRREGEVLALICEGLSTKEIGLRLKISAKTAECHRTRLMDKLDIHCVALLVRWAYKAGLIAE